MPPLTPEQQRRRKRAERLIALAAPALDLMLAAGDRVARAVGGEDDYIPIRAPGEAFEIGPGRRARPGSEVAD